MDPSATWRILAEAVQSEDWEEAEEHARNLLTWLEKTAFHRSSSARPHSIGSPRSEPAKPFWNGTRNDPGPALSSLGASFDGTVKFLT